MSGLERRRAALVVVDVQEAFRPYERFDAVARASAKLLEGARILGVPRVVTEQYPKGLGPTAPEVGLTDEVPVTKTVFSAARAEGFELGGASQAILCGIETHVCVAQTALDLLEAGLEVQVIADAVGSRHASDHERALVRLEGAGAVVSTVEAALFELLGAAGTPEFKAVQGLIL
ncbi:MAG: isochorismatase family protein [Acidobacteriota bacterium]|nr:isochorismatase family protein [Acidobacteriota bacterium]